MQVYLMAVGWSLVGMGALLAAHPRVMDGLVGRATSPGIRRGWAVVVLALSAATWWAAPASRWPLCVQTLAILGLAKGVVLLAAPGRAMTRMAAWWVASPAALRRVWALLSLGGGVALVWSLV